MHRVESSPTVVAVAKVAQETQMLEETLTGMLETVQGQSAMLQSHLDGHSMERKRTRMIGTSDTVAGGIVTEDPSLASLQRSLLETEHNVARTESRLIAMTDEEMTSQEVATSQDNSTAPSLPVIAPSKGDRAAAVSLTVPTIRSPRVVQPTEASESETLGMGTKSCAPSVPVEVKKMEKSKEIDPELEELKQRVIDYHHAMQSAHDREHGTIEALKKKLESNDDELQTLKQTILKFSADKATRQNLPQDSSAEMVRLTNTLEEEESKGEQLRQEALEDKKKHEMLFAVTEKERETILRLQEEISGKDTEIRELKGLLVESTATSENMKGATEETISRMRDEIVTRDKKLSDLEQEISMVQSALQHAQVDQSEIVSELKEKVATQAARLSEAKHESDTIVMLQKTISEKNVKLLELEQLLGQLNTEADLVDGNANETIEQLRHQLRARDREISELKEMLSNATIELQTCRKDLDSSNAAIASLREESVDKDCQLELLNNAADRVKIELQEAQENGSKTIEILRRDIAMKDDELKAKETEVQRLLALHIQEPQPDGPLVLSLQGRIKEKDLTLQAMEMNTNKLQSELDRLTVSQDQMNVLISQLEEKVRDKEEEISKLQGTLATHDDELEEYRRKVDAASFQQIEAMGRELEDKDRVMGKLKEVVASYRAETRSKENEKEKVGESASPSVEAEDTLVVELRLQVASLESEILRLRSEKRADEDAKDAIQEEMSRMEALLTALQSEKDHEKEEKKEQEPRQRTAHSGNPILPDPAEQEQDSLPMMQLLEAMRQEMKGLQLEMTSLSEKVERSPVFGNSPVLPQPAAAIEKTERTPSMRSADNKLEKENGNDRQLPSRKTKLTAPAQRDAIPPSRNQTQNSSAIKTVRKTPHTPSNSIQFRDISPLPRSELSSLGRELAIAEMLSPARPVVADSQRVRDGEFREDEGWKAIVVAALKSSPSSDDSHS